LLKSKKDQLTSAQVAYARDDKEWEGKEHGDLLSVIKEVKPHILIGTSTKPGAFTEEIVREMATHVNRPAIFPLSNPTKLHEAKPKDLYEWTDGRVLCATGSPFPPVEYKGATYEIAECNNSTIFPGIGLGAILCRTRLLPPSLLVAATKALAAQAPALKDPKAGLLPDVTDVREISVQIAKAVIRAAEKEELNELKDIPQDDGEFDEWIREQMWDPRYRPLKKVEPVTASAIAKGIAGSGSTTRGSS
jgi:malate dehydrogenase (oxaloacetate-decarboxylating)